MAAKKRRCRALRVDGERRRAWAVRGTGDDQAERPALCAAHGGLAQRGARDLQKPMVVDARQAVPVEGAGSQYDDHLSDLEFAVLEAAGRDKSLEGEVRLVRVALRRLFAGFGQEESNSVEMDRRALTLFKGAELVARLLQYERELEESEDGPGSAIEQALDELAEEWGLEPMPGYSD